MYNSDYIPLDKAVIDSNVKEFEQSRKVVLSKIRFDNGFEDSVVALNFMIELMIWRDTSEVDVAHLAFIVAYDYLNDVIVSMGDDYKVVLEVVSRWSHAFKCAYDHSSTVNFSWAFRELLKEVKPLIK